MRNRHRSRSSADEFFIAEESERQEITPSFDLADVRGQPLARRALEIAAAGGHSMMMIGPPGTGKTTLAHCLRDLLPPLTAEEARELVAVSPPDRSAGNVEISSRRPFRAPATGVTIPQLFGGRSSSRSCEIALAHHGVLFLDDLPRFNRRILDRLLAPLETGAMWLKAGVRHRKCHVRFQFISAMSPCPCGYLGERNRECRCTFAHIRKHRSCISNRFLDRIDLHVALCTLQPEELRLNAPRKESSAVVAQRVAAAQAIQLNRASVLNSRLEGRRLTIYCCMDESSAALLERCVPKLGLSARAFHRLCRVARTIADLEGRKLIEPRDMGEAIQFRRFQHD